MGRESFDLKPSYNRAARPRGAALDKVVRVLSVAFIVGAVLSIILVYTLVRNLAAEWTGTGIPSIQLSGGNGNGPAGSSSTPTAVLLDELPDPWTGTERITILLLGLDFRDWESGEGPPRTDSMMLFTLDPVSQTAGMLSIPRDLWVEIPAYGHGRINTAYFLGERDRLPGGGAALAVKTVEKFIGVPIPYYMQIDFGAFVSMVDEIGGIEIEVPEYIKIDPIGPDNTVRLEAGTYTFDGEVALAYARSRRSEGGDFDRARRQQQVALAIREKLLSLDTLPTLIAKSPALYQDVATGIHTNLALEEMISMGLLALQIPKENVNRGVIAPPNNVTLETVIYGGDEAEVLKPIPDQIRLLRDEIFTSTGAIGPSIDFEDAAAAAKQENARMAVLNGAGEEGLASRVADVMIELEFNVVEVTNADRMDYPQTRVIDYTGNPYTTQYLMELMDLTQSQILFQALPDSQIDVALIMGYDWYQLLPKLTSP
jgi:LCP family protein required for cell wall assembly